MSDEPLTQAPTEYRPPEVARGGDASKDQETFAPGDVVAERYRLSRVVGQGGMGVVWVARSLVLGVDVAIKLMRPGVARPEVTARMAREAQVMASLGHSALVRVFDFGSTAHGTPFLVMELARGETVGELLRREQRLSAVEAVQMVLPLADGLRVAHERGVVHRDIKPENVIVARDALGRRQPKLLDFGIAKLEQQPSDGRLTQMGAVLGSPEFMSPEQARGEQDTDARTDVWSLCVMLYEMLTGAVPFKNKNYNALIQAILHDPPVPTTQYAAGDRDLWRVIERGLEKSRQYRWASMAELGEALALWLYERGVTEDVAGNSVKALWLDGSLSGVSSDAPKSASDAPLPTLATRLRAPTGLRLLRARRRWLRGGALGVGGLLLFVAGAALFSAPPAELESETPGDVRAPAVAPALDPPRLEPAEQLVDGAMPPPSRLDVGPAAAPSTATPPPASAASSLASAPPSSTAPASAAPAPAPRKAEPRSRRIPQRATGDVSSRKPVRDFGF